MNPINLVEANPPLDSISRQAAYLFRQKFGHPCQAIAAAPGRVNLIGEHIDYNDGFVLPLAIHRYVVIAGRNLPPSTSPRATIFSDQNHSSESIPLDRLTPTAPGSWINYVAGPIAGFQQRGIDVEPFEACITSNVPLGGGLSSSAALEVAVATLLEQLTGVRLAPADKALLCQQAEHAYAGVPCGIMDQFSSVFGQQDELLLLDCRSQEIVPVPFPPGDWTILITNSNVKHALTGGEYASRRAQCDEALSILAKPSWRDVTMDDVDRQQQQLPVATYRRARHVVTEIARTQEAVHALQKNELHQLGNLMYASHQSLRDDFEVSCPELDALVAIAEKIGPAGGVLGSRMTGGGFGGCTVSLVDTNRIEAIARSIKTDYLAKIGIEPHFFASRPAPGASTVSVPDSSSDP